MWPYKDALARLIAYAARVEYVGDDGKREKLVLPLTYCQVEHREDSYLAWRACGVPAPRPLYRLPELLAAPEAPAIVCEGEKKADVVPRLFPGYVGTTSMGGAAAAKLSDWAPLVGREIIVWPDHDEPGRRYAEDVSMLAVRAGAASVAIIRLPENWPEGWDLADPLPNGVTAETLAALLRSAMQWGSWAEKSGTCPHAGHPNDQEAWPNPDSSLLDAQALPAPSFPDVLQAGWMTWAREAAEGAACPVDYVALPLLSAAGALIGNARWGSPWPGWREPPNLFVGEVGRPSLGNRRGSMW